MAAVHDRARRRRPRRSGEVARWLRQRPSLAELQAAYPQEWRHVQEHAAAPVREADPAGPPPSDAARPAAARRAAVRGPGRIVRRLRLRLGSVRRRRPGPPAVPRQRSESRAMNEPSG